MPDLYVELDEGRRRELEELLAHLPRGLEQALTRAINKVAVAARTRIVRRIVQEVHLTATELRRRNVRLLRATWRRLAAIVSISGRRIPLRRWGARQTRRGVSYAIRRGGRRVLEQAFLARIRSGHVGVMLRTGQPRLGRRLRRRGRGAGIAGLVRPRLPIAERYGPSAPAVAEGIEELARDTLEREIGARLDAEVRVQVGLVLQRRGGLAAAAAGEEGGE